MLCRLAVLPLLLFSFIHKVTSQPPPGFPQPVCLDLAFLIDTSCSISSEDKNRMVQFSRDLIKRLVFTNEGLDGLSIRVAAITFDKKSVIQFYFNGDQNEDTTTLDEALAAIPLKGKGCRTATDKAFADALQNVFVEENGDRVDLTYADRIVILTDARTQPKKSKKKLAKWVKKASEKENIKIDVVLFENNRVGKKPGKGPSDLEILVGDDEDRIYDVRVIEDTEDKLERLAQSIERDNACVVGDDPIIPACSDMVFVFDVSCSIDNDVRATAARLATNIANVLQASPETTQYAAVVYDKSVRQVFPLSNDPQLILEQLQNLNTTTDDCRTLTYEALQYVREKILNDGNDRDDAIHPDVVFLFTDGNTAPESRKGRTYSEAARYRNQERIDLVVFKLENNRGKSESSNAEFEKLPTKSGKDDGYLFPIGEDVYLNDDTYETTLNSALVYILPRYECVP